MAITATRLKSSVAGSERIYIGSVSINPYTTGGEAITPGTFGMGTVDCLMGEPRSDGQSLAYDRTNSKLKAFNAAGTEVTNGTNLSSEPFRVRVYGDNGNG